MPQVRQNHNQRMPTTAGCATRPRSEEESEDNMPWITKYMWVKAEDVPLPTNAPPGWENATIESGKHWPYYPYERFVDAPNWNQGGGVVKGKKLIWGRAFWYVPNQLFKIQRLKQDNTWEDIGTLQGPHLYWSLDSTDGDAQIMRLVAA